MDLHESSYGVALMARRTPAWREVYVGHETGGEEKGERGGERREERGERRGVRDGRTEQMWREESFLLYLCAESLSGLLLSFVESCPCKVYHSKTDSPL